MFAGVLLNSGLFLLYGKNLVRLRFGLSCRGGGLLASLFLSLVANSTLGLGGGTGGINEMSEICPKS